MSPAQLFPFPSQVPRHLTDDLADLLVGLCPGPATLDEPCSRRVGHGGIHLPRSIHADPSDLAQTAACLEDLVEEVGRLKLDLDEARACLTLAIVALTDYLETPQGSWQRAGWKVALVQRMSRAVEGK